MVFLAKEQNGGIDNLRENGWKTRAQHAVIKVYKKILKVADAFGLGKVVQSM